MGLVCGIGSYNRGKYRAYSNNENTLEYVTWNSMMNRGASLREKSRNATYRLCSIDERFLDFQWFAEWCNKQIGFGLDGYDLDKDILFKGNNVYSPETCVFIPRKLNTFLISCKSARGKYPIGVSVSSKSKRFMARCRVDGKRIYIGTYDTPEEAFSAYKSVKEKEAKRLAVEYAGKVDDRVIKALDNFVITIED